MDLTNNAVYPRGQLFSSIYGLNKTYTKKVVVGLEFDEVKRLFAPKVRLIGNDFIGIAFNPMEWSSLTNSFPHIDAYFGSYTNNYADQQIVGCNFSLRFTTAHSDKAVQIEELLQPARIGDCAQVIPVKKQYKRSIVMKRATFEKLRHIIHCVRAKLDYLDSIESSVEYFADQLGKHYLEELSQKHQAQITEVSVSDILSAGKLVETDFLKIAATFPTSEMKVLNMDEMTILTEELIFTNVEYIAFKAQNNIVYT